MILFMEPEECKQLGKHSLRWRIIKISRYWPGQALGVSRRLRLQNFWKIGT
jgi:hypothetical protein